MFFFRIYLVLLIYILVKDAHMKEEAVAGKSGDNEDEEMEEVDSDEWEDYEDDPLPVTRCLFCVKEFNTLEINAKYESIIPIIC